MKKLIAIGLLGVALSGCASTGPIQIGRDTYTISETNEGGAFTSVYKLAGKLTKEAATYCHSIGKQPELVTSNANQPVGPMAGLGGATITFRCLDANDPRYGDPTMRRDNGVTTVN